MAQTPRNPLAMQSLGRALTKLAKSKPGGPKDIELWAFANHGFRINEDTLRKAFKGQVDPGKCNVEVLVALMAWYACEPADLGEAAAKALAPLFSVVGGRPEQGPDQGVVSSRWSLHSVPAMSVESKVA